MKTLRVKQLADRLGKHPATIWLAIRRGAIDIDDENSVQQFLLAQVRPVQVRLIPPMFVSPFIPSLNSLLEQGKVGFICHKFPPPAMMCRVSGNFFQYQVDYQNWVDWEI